MKRGFFVIVSLLISLAAIGQTQKGYVKTKGRLGEDGKLVPGEPLSEVMVKVRDRNTVMSDKRGDFSFPMPDETYYLEDVSKEGYVLTDPDVLSKQYSYSKNRLVIALETREQQMEERMDINNKVMEAQKELITRLRAEVKQLKAENKITEEEYYKRLEEIVGMQNENQKLVEDMVERYSKIDYDMMNDFDRHFSAYLLSGDIRKADSLLKTKGDLTKRREDYDMLKAENAKQRAELDTKRKKLEKSEATERLMCDELASDYYRSFELMKLQHKNDSAAYWLEQRVMLDTTNENWLMETATFVRLYLADYNLALKYYTSSLDRINAKSIKNYEQLASVYNYIGHIYHHLGDLQNAKEYYELAINNLKNVADPNKIITRYYDNLGTIYSDMGLYDKSLEYHKEALQLLIDNQIEDSIRYTGIYNNLGSLYCHLDDYNKALVYYFKTLHIQENYGDKKPLEIAVSYNNIAYVYNQLNKFDMAIEFNNKAIELRKNILGEEHPDIAQSYNNIGYVYLNTGDLFKALEYMIKAVNIYKNLIGEQHQNIATFYNNIAIVYMYMGDLDMALEYTMKSLEIRTAIYKNRHEDIANSYSNLAALYCKKGNYDKAIEYNAIALDMYLELFGSEHSATATCYNNLGAMLETSGDYNKALEYYNKALDVRLKVLGPNNLEVAGVYGNIASVCIKKDDYKQALDNLNKNLAITENICGAEDSRTVLIKSKIFEVESKLAESKKNKKK